MFRAVSITFVGGIGAGATSSWMDDTDVTAAPEPTSIVLIGTGLLLLMLIRRWWGQYVDPDGPNCTEKMR
jgi:hypothetical protein